MIKLKHIVIFVICTFPLHPLHLNAAEFEWLAETIILKGEIVPGDYDKFIRIIKYVDRPPLSIQLNSNGGDVNEAIKIGKVVNELMMRATITDNNVCASSCFYILVSSPERTLDTDKIGIHRPYFNKSYFSKLSSVEAKIEYRRLNNYVANYLLKMGVPQDFIDRMFSISSDHVKWISRDEFYQIIGKMPPFFEELAIAKCGSDYTDIEYSKVRGLPLSSSLRKDFYKKYIARSTCITNLSSTERSDFIKKHGLTLNEPSKYKGWYDISFYNNEILFWDKDAEQDFGIKK